MTTAMQIDFTLTINDIVARHPETVAVFNRLGMDTCCGGGVPVDEAARRDGLDPDGVRASLLSAVAAAPAAVADRR
jgi:regulator of cell morphogenesis and NO signaling